MTERIQNIEDLTEPPTVGKFYMVPCVHVRETARGLSLGQPSGWLPVMGPKHGDAEVVEFPWRHWHYDFRFFTDRALRVLWGNPFSNVLRTETQPRQGTPEPLPGISSAPTNRRMKCRRAMPEYPADKVETLWLPELRKEFADKRVKCGNCPHRGLPLSSLPREPGTSIVTCPGHGLRWDLTTGSLVR